MTPPRPTARPRVILLGDTRDLHHHGCEAVLNQLVKGLGEVCISPDLVIAGMDWSRHADTCLNADLVVINGEGALHHDRPVVGQLTDLAVRRREMNRPTALVNFSWFENSPDATRSLKSFDLLAARDPSSREMIRSFGLPCLDAPDLAIREACSFYPTGVSPDGNFMVSDSTKSETTKRLRALARERDWIYLPVLYPPTEARPGAKSRKIHRKIKLARALGPLAGYLVSTRYHAHLKGVPDIPAYVDALAHSRGVLTGRFHTACFCLGLGVPVLAIGSNTAKIEALLNDAGLDPGKRMIRPEQLAGITDIPPFTDEELAALAKFRICSEERFKQLFAQLRNLLQPNP